MSTSSRKALLTAFALCCGALAAAATADDDVAVYLAKLPLPPASLKEAVSVCSDSSAWDSFNRRLDFTLGQLQRQGQQSTLTISLFNQDDRMSLSDYVNAATPPAHDMSIIMKGPFVQGMPAFAPPAARGENSAADKQVYAALESWLKQADGWWAGELARVKDIVSKPTAPFKPKHPEDAALVAGAQAQVSADRLPFVKQLADGSHSICNTIMESLPAEYLPGNP